MASDTARKSRRGKDNESNDSNGKNVASKSSTGSSSATPDTSAVKRSAREAPLKKNTTPSSSSTRKSERIEKRNTPTSPPVRKSERVEKQSMPNFLRRSERGKIASSSSSSGSKKSSASVGSSVMKKKKQKKEKSVKQLTMETKEVGKSMKQVKRCALVGTKRMDARAYRALFRSQPRNVNMADRSEEMENKEDKLSPVHSSDHPLGVSDVDGVGECSQGKNDEMVEEHSLRDSEKNLEESSSVVSKHAKEPLENHIGLVIGLQSPHSSQKHVFSEKAHQLEEEDGKGGLNGDDDPGLSSHIPISKQPNDITETERENMQAKLADIMVNSIADSEAELESSYKVTPSKRKRSMDSDTTVMVSNKENCSSDAEAITSLNDCNQNDPAKACATCSKRRRVGGNLEQLKHFSCNTKSNQDLCGTTLAKDRGEVESEVAAGRAEHETSSVDLQFDGDPNTCIICKLGGKLLCCDGLGCKRSYHLSCLDPPFEDVPLGVWHCLACVMKKMESGVHSVSEGIESIWDTREMEVPDDNGLQRQRQFFVKYKGLAHVHNRWVPESQLLIEAPSLLAKFNRKNQVTKWKQEWIVPHRMLQKRSLMSPKHCNGDNNGHVGGTIEWLVKWRGLDYEHATWELETATFMNSPEAQSLIRDYENRHGKAKGDQFLSSIDKVLAGGSPEFDKNHLDFVNNLHEYRKKGQNAVVIDDQEQTAKVISFILSLSSNASCPFLIITTSAALYSWEEELSRLAPSLYTVGYWGKKDIRKSIRALEFYEGGCIMFQVLITSPEVVVEDLNVLEPIKWEAVIVDECQRSRMYSNFEQIKLLRTAMKVLLVNGQLKDGIGEHLLSLIDCQSKMNGSEDLTNSSDKTSNLKERLSKYIANSCESDSSRFIEYWVPVAISPMQLEQYCSTLLLNSLSLCSSSKKNLIGADRDILISARKCCDHPYIVDPELQTSLTKDCKAVDMLDIGIKASGKLKLLDAMLSKIKDRGLRVLVLFQSSVGSGKVNIGDILDDFLRQRFGQDSYERVDGFLVPSKKQAALNSFNNQKERFVFLLETRACLPSIKLSSVDTVIIFGSDWSPMTDIRSLQKITLESQFEQIKIFRLYSFCTVEERALILARQRKFLDSNLQIINRSASHMLMWGASYLFDKLSEFHSGNKHASNGDSLFEDSLLKDVIEEFFILVSEKGSDNNPIDSIMLKTNQNKGYYVSSFPLHGEPKVQLMDEELPHMFWKKLLQGKVPKWKYISSSSQRNRKRVQYFNDLTRDPEVEGDEVVKRRRKVSNNADSQPPLIGTSGALAHNLSQFSSSSAVLDINAANHASHFDHSNNSSSPVPEVDTVKYDERANLDDSQKSLHLLLKPEIAKLCEILQLPEDVEDMAKRFLEYVMNYHHVSRESATILQAFQISLCWTAASLLKHKLDHKATLALAKQHLQFSCRKEEADFVYSKLRILKKLFLHHTGFLRSSQSMLSNLPNQEFSDSQVLSHLDLAQKDYTKSIKDIEKKCDKHMNKLLQKKREQKDDLEREYEHEKTQLEHKQKTEAAVIRIHSTSSMRTQKLQLLDIEYAKKFEELKRQMETRLNNLFAKHQTAMEKLQERKAQWIEAVNSWAEAELKNKLPANEYRHDQENAVPSNSCSKAQINERDKIMPGGEIPLEVPETTGSDEDVLPGVPSTTDPISDGATLNMLDREVPLGVPEIASVRDVSEDVVSVNAPSFEEQIPDVQVASICSIDDPENACHQSSSEEGSDRTASVVPETNKIVDVQFASITSSDDPEDASHKSSSEKGCDKTALMVPETSEEVDVQAASISSSDGPENASHKSSSEAGCGRTIVMVPETSKEGDVQVASISASEGCNTTALMVAETTKAVEQDDNTIIEREGAPSLVSDDANEVDQQNGVFRIVDHDFQIDNTTGVNQQNEEVASEMTGTCGLGQQDGLDPSGVHETPCAIGNGSTSRENGVACSMAPSYNTVVDKQDVVLSSGGCETASGEVEGGHTHIGRNRGHAMASNNGTEVLQPDGEVIIIDQDESQEPSLVLQNECPPAASSRSQDGAAWVCENQNPFQQVEAPVSQQDAGASDRSHNDALVMEQLLQLSPSTDSPSGLQPATCFAQHVPVELPVGGSSPHVSNIRPLPVTSGISNQFVTVPVTPGISYRPVTAPAVRMPTPVYQDPLQKEMERIREETEQIIKIHENTKLQLKSDREREIEEILTQIHRKYDARLQEVESEFFCKKKELEGNQNKVLMNKILAEAFRSKCMDIKANGAPGRQLETTSRAVQQLLQLSSQPTLQRPSIVGGPYSAGPPPVNVQTTTTSTPPAPSQQAVRDPALLSGSAVRPPRISSISPTTSNVQVGSEIRAPAPHLQPFRSSASVSAAGLPSFPHGMPSQQVPATSPTLPELPSRPSASSQLCAPHIMARPRETTGISPSSTCLSLLDSFWGLDDQTGANPTQYSSFAPQTDLGANSNPLAQPEPSLLNNALASEVVYLSDDD